MRAQELIVEELLQEVGGFVSSRPDKRRNVNLVVLLAIVHMRFLFRRSAWLAANDRQQLAHVLNLVKTFGRGDRATSILDCSRELDKHQTVKTEIAESR